MVGNVDEKMRIKREISSWLWFNPSQRSLTHLEWYKIFESTNQIQVQVWVKFPHQMIRKWLPSGHLSPQTIHVSEMSSNGHAGRHFGAQQLGDNELHKLFGLLFGVASIPKRSEIKYGYPQNSSRYALKIPPILPPKPPSPPSPLRPCAAPWAPLPGGRLRRAPDPAGSP